MKEHNHRKSNCLSNRRDPMDNTTFVACSNTFVAFNNPPLFPVKVMSRSPLNSESYFKATLTVHFLSSQIVLKNNGKWLPWWLRCLAASCHSRGRIKSGATSSRKWGPPFCHGQTESVLPCPVLHRRQRFELAQRPQRNKDFVRQNKSWSNHNATTLCDREDVDALEKYFTNFAISRRPTEIIRAALALVPRLPMPSTKPAPRANTLQLQRHQKCA